MTEERKTWRVSELNLVRNAAKTRQAEDRLRADAWRKTREAELEAVVNRSYSGMEIPEIAALVAKVSELIEPHIQEFNRLTAAHYPAEFARPTLSISLVPGGIPPEVRNQVRRDAATHLSARHAYMLANSAAFTTEVLSDATQRTTDNPEVQEALERLAVAEPRDADLGATRTGNWHFAQAAAAP